MTILVPEISLYLRKVRIKGFVDDATACGLAVPSMCTTALQLSMTSWLHRAVDVINGIHDAGISEK